MSKLIPFLKQSGKHLGNVPRAEREAHIVYIDVNSITRAETRGWGSDSYTRLTFTDNTSINVVDTASNLVPIIEDLCSTKE